MQQLQNLHLRHCTVFDWTLTPAEVAHQEQEVPVGLPAVLARLTDLRELVLQECYSWPVERDPEHFSALTASPALERLDIWNSFGPVLPPGAVQHMFGPGRQLQGLTSLILETAEAMYAVDHPEEWDSLAWLSCACISAADARCLAAACPALRRLGVCNSLTDFAAVEELLHLPQCCGSLSVGGTAFDDAAASVVAQLTQLTDLTWGHSPDLTDLGLQELTALRELQHLALFSTESISQEMFLREDPKDAVDLSDRWFRVSVLLAVVSMLADTHIS